MEISAIFGIFLRKECLNQKIALHKKVLEFHFMANSTLKKWKIQFFQNSLHLAKFVRFFQKNYFFIFFRVLLAIKLNSKTFLHSAIFWFRPSFLKKMPKIAHFSTFEVNYDQICLIHTVRFRGLERVTLWPYFPKITKI